LWPFKPATIALTGSIDFPLSVGAFDIISVCVSGTLLGAEGRPNPICLIDDGFTQDLMTFGEITFRPEKARACDIKRSVGMHLVMMLFGWFKNDDGGTRGVATATMVMTSEMPIDELWLERRLCGER
jgi:hypothetical protein